MGTFSHQAMDSTSTRKSSSKGKLSPQAKEHKNKHHHDDHHPPSSSQTKDQSHGDKGSKHSSDKEGSSAVNQENCKCCHSPDRHAFSVEYRQKDSHIDSSTYSPSGSLHTKSKSPCRSMSDLDDCVAFTAPNSSLTPYKPRSCSRYHSASTDSRCSSTPMDLSLYNSFSYLSFGGGGATPMGCIAGSYHISSSMLPPMELFSPGQPTHGTLSMMQTKEIYDQGAECQALGTQLAKLAG